MARRKRKKRLTWFGRLLMDLFLVASLSVAGYSGWMLYSGLKEYKDSNNAYDQVKDIGRKEPVYVEANDEPVEEDLHTLPEPVIDFEGLKKVNSDFLGWIYLPDSMVDYPFVQGRDNEQYLYNLFTGEYNKSGSVFMDAANDPGFQDTLTCLYAHHMRNGTMFADIEKYKDSAYYETHKVIQIVTENASYEMYPLAGMVSNGSTSYVKLSFGSEQEYMDYVDLFYRNSSFRGEATVQPFDKLMLLSTCSYDVVDGRFALLGKLVQVR